MPRSPLHNLEREAEEKAQEYKRQLIEEGMKRLAEQEKARLFSPQGNPLPPDQDASADDDDDGGRSHD